MGMYDSFFALDNESAAFLRCAEGHPLKNREFQSKSLHCNLDNYYVIDKTLYRLHEDSESQKQFTVEGRTGLLITTTRSIAEFESLNQEVDLYTSCYECDPVCFEIGDSSVVNFDGRLNHREPIVHYLAKFDDGQLVQANPLICETRQAIRERLTKEGLHVLPDEDRIVKRHFALLRERDHKYRPRQSPSVTLP